MRKNVCFCCLVFTQIAEVDEVVCAELLELSARLGPDEEHKAGEKRYVMVNYPPPTDVRTVCIENVLTQNQTSKVQKTPSLYIHTKQIIYK